MSTRLVEIRNVVLVTLASAAAAVLVPVLPFVGLPIAGFGLGWLTFRYGTRWSVPVVFVATGLAVLVYMDPVIAVLAGPALLACGPLAALGLRYVGGLRTLAVVTLIVLVALLVFDAAVVLSQGQTIGQERRAEAAQMRKIAVASAKGASPADARRVGAVADQVAGIWPKVWPAYYLYLAAASALGAVWSVSRAAAGSEVEVRGLPRLGALDVSAHFLWPTIAGFAALAYAAWRGEPLGWVGAMGVLLLLSVRPVLFMQGLAVAAAAYDRLGTGRLGRAAGYTVLTGLELLFVPSVSVLGLIDLLANFRKIPRAGDEPPAKKSEIGG